MAKDNLKMEMLFKLPPEKAVEYIKNKGFKITNDWREMWEEAHTQAFTISKMTDAQLLKDSKTIIDTAISEGWSSSKAERELTNLYKKKGWWGKAIQIDKDGNEKEVQLGSARRVKTIFRTNMQTAYSAQRYLQSLEDVDFAPYWQYKAILDNRTRREHRALNDKVFRYDDEFWDKFYPPNGFGCRCFVKSLSEQQLKSKGLKVEKSTNKLTTQKVNVNADTSNGSKEISAYRSQDNAGNVVTTKTDAGWNYNVGKYAWKLDVLAYKEIEQLPEKIKDKFISQMAQNPHRKDYILEIIRRMLAKDFKNAKKEVPITWLTPLIINTLNKMNNKPITPVIVFERGQVSHSLNPDIKVAKQILSQKQFENIYDYLNNPDEVFYDTKEQQLLFVNFLPKDEIIDGRDCIKIPVNINSTNPKRPVNYIGTTGRINYKSTFMGKQFIKIE